MTVGRARDRSEERRPSTLVFVLQERLYTSPISGHGLEWAEEDIPEFVAQSTDGEIVAVVEFDCRVVVEALELERLNLKRPE